MDEPPDSSPQDGTEPLPPVRPSGRPDTSKPSASHYVPELPLAEELHALLGDAYVVESFLGQGGMGAVYKGLQMPLRRPVAIKILTKRQAGEEDDFAFEERFKREAYAMAALTHPHIVQVYDCGDAGEHHLFISMELVEGGDLGDAIKQGRLATEAALQLIPQICAGMQAAHERGLVHRDIKPANIFLTKDGRAKVADFGLAKRFDAKSTFVTKTGLGMGTPDYAAPEQYDGVRDLDHRADIYALGVMMYQMLTGRLPRGTTYKTPSQITGVDPRIDEVVARAMATEREERYQSTAEIAADLAGIAGTVGTKARPVPTKTGAAPRATSPVSRTPTPALVPGRAAAPPKKKKENKSAAIIIIAFVVTIALLAGGAWLMQKPKREPSGPEGPTAPTGPPWEPLFTEAEWKKSILGRRDLVDGRLHLQKEAMTKPRPTADGAIRARIQWQQQQESTYVIGRRAKDLSFYRADVASGSFVRLGYYPRGLGGGNNLTIQTRALPKPLQPGDTVLLELRMQGDRLTVLADGAALIDVRDSRIPGPGEWGIGAFDGWFESAEVQTLPTVPASPPLWQPLFTDTEWNKTVPDKREVVDGRLHLQKDYAIKRRPTADGAIRARIQWQQGSQSVGFNTRYERNGYYYRASVDQGAYVDLSYMKPGADGGPVKLARRDLPKRLQPGDSLLLEFRLQGDRLTVLADNVVLSEVRDSRLAGPGLWGLAAGDGWYESVEVETQTPDVPPPQTASPAIATVPVPSSSAVPVATKDAPAVTPHPDTAATNPGTPLSKPIVVPPTPKAVAPAPPLIIIRELAELDAQFRRLETERVVAPFEASLGTLNIAYAGGLDREILKEKTAGHLDGIMALEAEKDLISEKQPVPPDDEPQTSPALINMRSVYRTSFARLNEQRAANLKVLVDPLVVRLKQLEVELTKSNRLDDAKAVLLYREAMETDADPESAVAASKYPRGDDRKAAEWVINSGGSVTIENNGTRSEVREVAQLPRGKFAVIEVSLSFDAPPKNPIEDIRSLAGLKSLERVRLRHLPPIDDDDLDVLMTLPALSWLEVSACDLTDAALVTIAKVRSLQAVHLYLNLKMSGAALSQLAPLPKLSELNLNCCGLNDEGFKNLTRLVHLTTLHLSEMKTFRDEHLPVLESLKKLIMLDVSRSGVTVPGLSRCKGISGLVNLKLTIPIGGGANQFDELAKACPKIVRLSEVYSDLSRELTAQDIAAAAAFPKLGEFNISRLTDPAMAGLLAVPNLASLGIGGSAITDAGLLTLLPHKGLRSIRFGDSKITDAGLLQLKEMRKLKEIFVGSSLLVTDAGIAALKRARPDLRVAR